MPLQISAELLETIGFHTVLIPDLASNHPIFLRNELATQSCDDEFCQALVQQARDSGFAPTFHFPLGENGSLLVRCRMQNASCILFWKDFEEPDDIGHEIIPYNQTERRKHQACHRFSKSAMKIIEHCPASLMIMRMGSFEDGQTDSEIVACSDFAARTYGLSKGKDMLFKRGSQFLKDSAEENLTFWRSSRTASDHIARRRTESVVNGERKTFENSVTPFDIPGCSHEAYFLTSRDVSEAIAEATASEIRYRQTLDNLPVYAFESDADSRLLWANKRYLDTTGQTMEEAKGYGWKDVLVGNSAEAWVTSRSGQQYYEQEFQIRLADGSVRDYLGCSVPVFGSNGQIERWVGTSTDVTNAKEAERKLIAANEHLDAISNMKSTFISHISHEIRTPLNAILNMLKFLGDTTLTTEQREYVSICLQSSEHLMNVLNDCLDLSKIEAGKLTILSEDFSLRQLVLGCVEMFCDTAASKHLDLWCKIAPRVPDTVRGDPTRIRQVLSNFLSNACKYTPQGSVFVHVDVGDDPSFVNFEIRDTGFGIPEEQKESLFQPFSQVLGSKQIGIAGTGLGLSIAFKLCTQMGGSIHVKDNHPNGSIFSFSLPILDSPFIPVPPAPPDHCPVALVLHPDPTARQSIQSLFDALPHDLKCRVESHDTISPSHHHNHYSVVICPPFVSKPLGRRVPLPINTHACLLLKSREGDQQQPAAAKPSSALTPSEFICQDADFHELTLPLRPFHFLRLLRAILKGENPHEHATSPVQASVERDEPSHSKFASSHSFPATETPHHKILVAEDNLINQKVIKKLCEDVGMEPTIVADGRQCVDVWLLDPSAFCAILMDLNMPIMGGIEATMVIRRHEAELHLPSQIPIIALSANAMSDIVAECKAAGMNDFLAKPVRLPELLSTLKPFLVTHSA